MQEADFDMVQFLTVLWYKSNRFNVILFIKYPVLFLSDNNLLFVLWSLILYS